MKPMAAPMKDIVADIISRIPIGVIIGTEEPTAIIVTTPKFENVDRVSVRIIYPETAPRDFQACDQNNPDCPNFGP